MPNIIGLGVDLTEIPRIVQTIERYGTRFLQRIFTEGEIAYCMTKKGSAESFAARFAAKEAGAKALGTGISRGISWKELEGIHNRGDFDLSRHAAASGENLDYFDPATEEHFIPWIVETAGGPDRAAFTFLIDAYRGK